MHLLVDQTCSRPIVVYGYLGVTSAAYVNQFSLLSFFGGDLPPQPSLRPFQPPQTPSSSLRYAKPSLTLSLPPLSPSRPQLRPSLLCGVTWGLMIRYSSSINKHVVLSNEFKQP